ncbi:MAG: hypothetical protein IJX22_00615 [Opitutales bacterium]|nr:hypothetical protein [Opitutales bacterium]
MSAEKFLIFDIPVRMNECGPDGFLRQQIWFDYLQHVAAVHAEEMGFGMSAVRERCLIWVLSRIKLKLEAEPRYDDVVRIETYPNGADRLFAKRQFILSSAKTGKRFGAASSFWLTLDFPTLRPRLPSTVLDLDVSNNLEREDFFPSLGKLSGGETGDPATHAIRASHIDLNDHLNNSYYAEFTSDWLAQKLGKAVRFKELQINFNRAMVFGEELRVSGRLDGNAFFVEGTDSASGKNSFHAQGLI